MLPRGWADALHSAEPAVTSRCDDANPTTVLQMVLTPLLSEKPSLASETQQIRSVACAALARPGRKAVPGIARKRREESPGMEAGAFAQARAPGRMGRHGRTRE